MGEFWNCGPETEDCVGIRGYEDVWEEAEVGELGVEEDEQDYCPMRDGSDNQRGGIGTAKTVQCCGAGCGHVFE